MNEDLIIGVDRFKYFTGVSKGFDSKFLAPLIIQATDLISQNILGTALMIKLRTDYNELTLTGAYQELYNSDKASVEKMVIYQALILGLPRMLYKIGAETISTGDTEEVSSIGTDELSLLQRQASASKVFYENQVIDYLRNNRASLPELDNNTPDYLRANLTERDTSQGTTYSINRVYEI